MSHQTMCLSARPHSSSLRFTHCAMASSKLKISISSTRLSAAPACRQCCLPPMHQHQPTCCLPPVHLFQPRANLGSAAVCPLPPLLLHRHSKCSNPVAYTTLTPPSPRRQCPPPPSANQCRCHRPMPDAPTELLPLCHQLSSAEVAPAHRILIACQW
jgi:hypothetical protein